MSHCAVWLDLLSENMCEDNPKFGTSSSCGEFLRTSPGLCGNGLFSKQCCATCQIRQCNFPYFFFLVFAKARYIHRTPESHSVPHPFKGLASLYICLANIIAVSS